MQSHCPNCGSVFQITQSDLDFYDKISPVFNGKKILLAPPTHCSECRQQRRIAWRNERKLYERPCDLCKQSMITAFHPNSPYTVYCHDCWWSHKWDPTEYGQEYDFNRPFFEQFQDLMQKVPKAGVFQLNNENCKYNQLLAFSKNTYLSPGSYLMENCIYVRKGQYCRDCINSNALNKCELVADSSNCDGCNTAHHLMNCRSCSFSSYLQDCSNLQNCMMCCGLKSKQYCFKNEKYSKDEYEDIVKDLEKKNPDELLNEFLEFCVTIPRKAQIQLNCENSSGDYLYNCHNAAECFDCFEVEDSKYIFECEGVKDSMDLSSHDKDIELCYEMSSGGEKNYQTKFCLCSIASPRSAYLYSCFYLRDSFGCDGFHERGQYCILNKQYSKEEYEELVPKIIEHMKKTGEWGEFFPITLSPFAYNETTAQDYFPITKQGAEAKGWRWLDEKDEMPQVDKIIPAEKLPDSIEDIPDDILNWAIECKATKRPYRVIKQELEFYRRMKLPVPKFHPDERHKRRMALRNPRKLWDRTCDKCSKAIQTTYAPERPEIVYCEECYLKEVY